MNIQSENAVSENNLYLLSDSLRYLTHLTSLNLAFNRFTEVPEGLENLEDLEHLSLMFNHIVTDSIFCKLSRLHKLKTLLIGGTIAESDFSCFSTFPHLEALIVNSGQAALIRKNSSYFPSLKHLEQM